VDTAGRNLNPRPSDYEKHQSFTIAACLENHLNARRGPGFQSKSPQFVFIDNDVVLPVEIPTVWRCPDFTF
jgi:hypothetical protein